ncbi:MAG: hypothetical protein GWN79_29355 [Actinobacteria bacterium]|nr:hypothetical protein [Actinomycetota bacterium]NIS37477.1 hypothetical protein [Actinomycetota bacterium]NIT99297.1 hypothetical protein [Actinomycetota bacterium]NIU22894.1 hypothetical protein [Actinomycetota bacterium]NIU71887.1 hypothetical protein [Actinomycetota bacterium]
MSSQRLLVLVVVAATLASALVLDQADRDVDGLATPVRASVPIATGARGTWFCPGGTAPNGKAEVAVELVNPTGEPARAVVTGVRSGTGAEPLEAEVAVEAGERVTVALAEVVNDSAWMGAVVEVDSGGVVVEQTVVGPTGTDRAPCHTRTSTRWVVASGATRAAAFGEEMFLVLMNPFQDDAVVDIAFDADVGVDTLEGAVVPARRVVAIDVTAEVTVAARVSAILDVRAGRIAVNRMQIRGLDSGGEGQGEGLTVTPAAIDTGPVWYLPTVHRAGRSDVVSVTNPSPTETAEVDLEIVADGDLRFDPVELTIRPGRTVQVVIDDEERLGSLGEFSVIARSLSGLPVAVMAESRRLPGDEAVPTTAATVGSDVAATRWIAPMEGDQSTLVILNPSADTIATVELRVADPDGETVVATVEVAQVSRAVIDIADLPGERPIVVVEASAPVVVGRDLVGVSSHRMSIGVPAGGIRTGAAVTG